MKQKQGISDKNYRVAMGRLLVMYTQVDYLIMRAHPSGMDQAVRQR